MWLQRFSTFLLTHRWRALLLTFLITFVPIPLIGVIGIIIALFMTLMKGPGEGVLFMVAALLPYGLGFLIKDSTSVLPLMAGAAFVISIVVNVLSWVFAIMLYKKATWSQILQVAALLGVLAVSVIHLIYPNVDEWWAKELQEVRAIYAQTLKNATPAPTNTTPATTTDAAKAPSATNVAPVNTNANASATSNVTNIADDAELEAISTMTAKPYDVTGFLTAGILFFAILQLIFARWWQAAVYSPGALRKELYHIRLSKLAGVLFILSLVLAYLGNAVVLDIMPILYLLFAAAGLSLLHYVFKIVSPKTGWIWLTIVYLTMVVSIIMIALLGLIDIWFDLRVQVKKI